MTAESNAQKPSLLARLLPKKLIARGASQMWGPMLPMATKLSPKMLARFSGLIDNEDFARIIADTPDEQLEAGLQSKLRGVIFDEIVNRMQEEFIASRANDLDAIIEFQVGDRPDGGTDIYQVRIKDAKCETAKGKAFGETATSTIEVGAVDFLKMSVGVVSGIDLYLGGKLKWDGGMMMLTRLTRIFNIPELPKDAKASPAPAAA